MGAAEATVAGGVDFAARGARCSCPAPIVCLSVCSFTARLPSTAAEHLVASRLGSSQGIVSMAKGRDLPDPPPPTCVVGR